jgi:uncharacterized protein YkvS
MKTFQEVRSAIKVSGFTNDELNSLAEAIKYARAELVRDIKRSISVGDAVKFTSGRDGSVYTGTVRKINIKYVIVDTPRGGYRVPASMLTAV